MKKEISISYQKTINLGNYESAKIQADITQEILKGDKRNNMEIFDELFEECEDFVLERCEVELKK